MKHIETILIGLTIVLFGTSIVFFLMWYTHDCETSVPSEVEKKLIQDQHKIEIYDQKIKIDSTNIHNSNREQLDRHRQRRFNKYMYGDTLHN